ncbi:hypothetical protein GWQ29_10285 [Aeromonas sp. 2HA2]|uniref:hypothetical protein n=1 Tax=Aeromonas sp. 2HA2 TaxID=2699194 RepID=UPI0023DDC7E4|nr:hypothetical protein [Aeromonas sp. 2HA2]MDF2409807.1 hypothetical protein [Aeromonas sp. 2HA2]
MGHRAVALLMAAQHDGKKRQDEKGKKNCLGIDMPRSQPATSNQQPATSNQQPATSNQQPAIFFVPKISKNQMRKGRSLSGLF